MHLSRHRKAIFIAEHTLGPGDGERYKDQRMGKNRRRDVRTSKRYGDGIDAAKRATIYFDADVHRALRLRAAACNRATSDMVHQAVRMLLAEDADDLRNADQRQAETSVGFEEFVRSLRDSSRL